MNRLGRILPICFAPQKPRNQFPPLRLSVCAFLSFFFVFVSVFAADAADENLARNGVARQSTTGSGGDAGRAIDGNTNGNYRANSVSHTENIPGQWWEVTLRKASAIHAIVLWNRTDCCGERLSKIRASVRNDNGQTVWSGDFFMDGVSYPITTVQGFRIGVPTGTSGRTVRIERVGKAVQLDDVLSLAEVQVFGAEPGDDLSAKYENLARAGSTRQSTTGSGGDASRAIDGNTDGNFPSNSVTHTDAAPGAWWEVALPNPSTIYGITIWNRTDCCEDRLTSFRVETLDKAGAPATWSKDFYADGAGFPRTIISGFKIALPQPALARTVRVSLPPNLPRREPILSLSEVEVFGVKVPPPPVESAGASKAVVVTCDGGWIQAGFAGDTAPKLVFPAIVGVPRHTGVMVGPNAKDKYVGDEAHAKRGILQTRLPLASGKVDDWSDLEAILRQVYKDLNVASDKQPVFISEHPLTSREDRERLVQLMFTTFHVPAVCTANRTILPMYAAGQSDGVVIDIGWAQSYAVPVQNRQAITSAIQKLDVGEREIVDRMVNILAERGFSLTTTAEKEIVRDITEKLAYFAADYDAEMSAAASSSDIERNYTMPDGQVVTVGAERFRAPECLFHPSFLGLEQIGLPDLIHEAITQSVLGSRSQVTLVSSGKIAGFPRFDERVVKEVVARSRPSVRTSITSPPDRKFGAWRGASQVASRADFPGLCVSRREFDVSGAAVVNIKIPDGNLPVFAAPAGIR